MSVLLAVLAATPRLRCSSLLQPGGTLLDRVQKSAAVSVWHHMRECELSICWQCHVATTSFPRAIWKELKTVDFPGFASSHYSPTRPEKRHKQSWDHFLTEGEAVFFLKYHLYCYSSKDPSLGACPPPDSAHRDQSFDDFELAPATPPCPSRILERHRAWGKQNKTKNQPPDLQTDW